MTDQVLMSAARPPSPLLAEGTRLVHIGPPKTGTTSLQAAFDASRDRILAQGVRYAGWRRHSRSAVYALLNRPARPHDRKPPPIALWDELVAEIRTAREPRVVFSSEIFADGDAAMMRRVVDDLDPTRVHVVATLRPLPRILASQWQQGVRGGLRVPFEAWLREVFDGHGSSHRRFWRRHRHDALIASWADVIGIDNVTAVVVDDRDHGVILRAFEQLLGLRDGTLIEVRDNANRSMTLSEAEAIRGFNDAVGGSRLSQGSQYQLRRLATHLLLTQPPEAGESRIEAPQWALDRAAEVGREILDGILGSGVRIVGDAESLASPSRTAAGDDRRAAPTPRSVAGSFWHVGSICAGRWRRRLARRLRPTGSGAP